MIKIVKCSRKNLKQNFRGRKHPFRLRKEKTKRNGEEKETAYEI